MAYGSLAPYAILEGSWQPVGNWLPYITWCAMRTNKSLSAKVRMAWSHREAPVFQTNNESLLSDTGACGGVPQGTHCGRPGAVSPPQLWHGGGYCWALNQRLVSSWVFVQNWVPQLQKHPRRSLQHIQRLPRRSDQSRAERLC